MNVRSLNICDLPFRILIPEADAYFHASQGKRKFALVAFRNEFRSKVKKAQNFAKYAH